LSAGHTEIQSKSR